MKPSKPKRPAAARQPRRKAQYPSYSVTRFLREFRQAARDAAKFGKVEVRERGKVIGFLLKPSVERRAWGRHLKTKRGKPKSLNGVKLAPADGVPITSKEVKSALGGD